MQQSSITHQGFTTTNSAIMIPDATPTRPQQCHPPPRDSAYPCRSNFRLKKYLTPQWNHRNCHAGHHNAEGLTCLRINILQDEPLNKHDAKRGQCEKCSELAEKAPLESEIVRDISTTACAVRECQTDSVRLSGLQALGVAWVGSKCAICGAFGSSLW